MAVHLPGFAEMLLKDALCALVDEHFPECAETVKVRIRAKQMTAAEQMAAAELVGRLAP